MIDQYIGYAGLGNDTEFEKIKESELAIYVRVLGCDTELWIPKSVIQGDGSLSELGCSIFNHNYRKATGG